MADAMQQAVLVLKTLPFPSPVYHTNPHEQETKEAEFPGVRNSISSGAYAPPSVGFTPTEGRGDSHPVSDEGLTARGPGGSTPGAGSDPGRGCSQHTAPAVRPDRCLVAQGQTHSGHP